MNDMFGRNMGARLDAHITGNYGEDQFPPSYKRVAQKTRRKQSGKSSAAAKRSHNKPQGKTPAWCKIKVCPSNQWCTDELGCKYDKR